MSQDHELTPREALGELTDAIVRGVPRRIGTTVRGVTGRFGRLRLPKFDVTIERGPRLARIGNEELRLHHVLDAGSRSISAEEVDTFIATLEREVAGLDIAAQVPTKVRPRPYVGATMPDVHVERVWRLDPSLFAVSYAHGARFGSRVTGAPKRYLVMGFVLANMDPFGHLTKWLRPGVSWFGPGKPNVASVCPHCGALGQGQVSFELEFDAFADPLATERLLTLLELLRAKMQAIMSDERVLHHAVEHIITASVLYQSDVERLASSSALRLLNDVIYENPSAIVPLADGPLSPLHATTGQHPACVLMTGAIRVDDSTKLIVVIPMSDGDPIRVRYDTQAATYDVLA